MDKLHLCGHTCPLILKRLANKNVFNFFLASDGEAPAASLFQLEYFKLLNSALREGGITCSQGKD